MGTLGVVLWFAGLNFILFLMLTGGRAPFEGEQGGQLARAGLPLLFHDFWPYNLINFTPRCFPIHLS